MTRFCGSRCPYTFPLIRGQGTAKVKCKSSQKLDQQQAAGKAKAKTKQMGTDTSTVTILLEWRTIRGADGKCVIWPVVELMLNGIDPNGPNHGGPFEFRHPDANRRTIKSIMVKDIGEVEWAPGGWIGRCQINAIEWEIPKKAAAGVGSKTPTKAAEWFDTATQTTKIGSNHNVIGGFGDSDVAPHIGSNGNSVGGFDGPAAPNASP